jgi:arylformamidase
MQLDEYPMQEPLSAAGAAYGADCWRRSDGLAHSEIGYGADPYQRLMVFNPQQPDGRVLLFWHGGGWTSGYKEWMAFMAPAFTAAGVTFVSAGYRLAPQHFFPAGLEDCLAALAWVRNNISKNVFIGGHSAGGHYAALIAACEGGRLVSGCLPLSGVFEFGAGSGMSMRPRFLGSDPDNDRRAAPLFQIQPPLPPFLIAYGTNDFPHLIAQAEKFAATVRVAGGAVDTLPMDGRTHFTSSYAGGEADGPWVPTALTFMQRGK